MEVFGKISIKMPSSSPKSSLSKLGLHIKQRPIRVMIVGQRGVGKTGECTLKLNCNRKVSKTNVHISKCWSPIFNFYNKIFRTQHYNPSCLKWKCYTLKSQKLVNITAHWTETGHKFGLIFLWLTLACAHFQLDCNVPVIAHLTFSDYFLRSSSLGRNIGKKM